VAIRVCALERHPVWLVVVLEDLDPVRPHAIKRGANIRTAGETEPEMQERLGRADILSRVRRAKSKYMV
jgi:hypothetical protein